MNKTVIAIFIILFAGFGFYLWQTGRAPKKTAEIAAVDFKDISYKLDGRGVNLTDGGIKYFGNEAKGDFDGDGLEDIAFLLTYEGGGSGTFFYVAAALKTTAGYSGTNAILLGDRISPETTEFRDGEIIVNYADRKPSEPMTARPSVGVSRYLKVEGGALVDAKR